MANPETAENNPQPSEPVLTASIPSVPHSSHIPGLDGLRAVAVLFVFFSHCQLGFPGRFGPFGVTVFFFLSGYLITTLLQKEYDRAGTISLKDFYLRRILRIVPPMLITISIVTAVTALRGQEGPTAGTFLIQAFSLTNYFMIFNHYAHGIPNMQPMWSLSVEEHFYLIYPFLFTLLYRKPSPKALGITLSVIAIVVAAVRCWDVWQVHDLWHNAQAETWIYQNLDIATHTRVDSIIYGCLFALFANPVRGSQFATKLNSPPVVTGAFLLLLAAISAHYVQDSIGYVLLGVAFVPLFTATIMESRSGWLRFLESKPMRFMGGISYTFYLIHVSFLMTLRPMIQSHVLCALVAFMGALAFSAAMLLAVERPLAKIRARIAHA